MYCVCTCKTATIVKITDIFCSCGVCGQMMMRDLTNGKWKPFPFVK